MCWTLRGLFKLPELHARYITVYQYSVNYNCLPLPCVPWAVGAETPSSPRPCLGHCCQSSGWSAAQEGPTGHTGREENVMVSFGLLFFFFFFFFANFMSFKYSNFVVRIIKDAHTHTHTHTHMHTHSTQMYQWAINLNVRAKYLVP